MSLVNKSGKSTLYIAVGVGVGSLVLVALLVFGVYYYRRYAVVSFLVRYELQLSLLIDSLCLDNDLYSVPLTQVKSHIQWHCCLTMTETNRLGQLIYPLTFIEPIWPRSKRSHIMRNVSL